MHSPFPPPKTLVKGLKEIERKQVESKKEKSSKKSIVQDEYIRNLQHQIYLLELETRYL